MADQALSLRDELAKGLEGGEEATTGTTGAATSGEATTATTTVATEQAAQAEQTTAATDGRVRDDKGRFVKQEGKKDQAAEAQASDTQTQQATAPAKDQQQEAQQTQQQSADLPPSTWTPAAKAEYAKLPEVVRAEIKKREADFQKGIGQYKGAADFGNRITESIRPYEAIIKAKGGTPEGVIANLLQTAYLLNTGTPQERGALLMKAAEQYGADLSQWMKGQAQTGDGQQAQGQDQNAIAKTVQQLLQPHLEKINQFQSQFATAQQRREQAQQQEAQGHIEAFRTAIDEKGQPKHVYFDNVRGLMGTLIEHAAQEGKTLSLEEAYAMACNAVPEVRKALDAEQRQRDEAARLEAARRAAEDAKRAQAVNVSGQGGVGIADTSKLGLRDELEARLDGRIA